MPARPHVGTTLEARPGIAVTVASLLRIAAVAACLALGACTTVGVHTRQRVAVDYGPPVQMRVCVLRAPGVTTQRVNELVAAVNTEFAAYGIEVIVPWIRAWPRSGSTFQHLFDDVTRRELEAPCDRLMAFGDRNVSDFILGAVDQGTHTRGFVVATRVSLNQVIRSPVKVTIHEFYHLLGCPHAARMTDCYGRIAALKRSRAPREDFFPGVGPGARFLVTRSQVNSAVRGAIGMGLQPKGLKPDTAGEVAQP